MISKEEKLQYHLGKEYIAIDDCNDKHLYYIKARNADYGIYNSDTFDFTISRFKFRDNFLFEECHWDIGSKNKEMECFGTVKPFKDLGSVPEEILKSNEAEILKYLNSQRAIHESQD